MRDILMTQVGTINLEKLDADIRALSTDFSELSQGKDRSRIVLHFFDRASEADIAAAQGLVTSHDPTSKTPDQQLLATIRSTAQSAVGVALGDLTAAQVRSLLAVLLWKNGAINADGTIKAPQDWTVR